MIISEFRRVENGVMQCKTPYSDWRDMTTLELTEWILELIKVEK